MAYEPFWRLIPTAEATALAAAEPEGDGQPRKSKTVNYSKKALRTNYRYAEIDAELFQLMRCVDSRASLRTLLITKYLSNQPNTIIPAALPLLAALANWIA